MAFYVRRTLGWLKRVRSGLFAPPPFSLSHSLAGLFVANAAADRIVPLLSLFLLSPPFSSRDLGMRSGGNANFYGNVPVDSHSTRRGVLDETGNKVPSYMKGRKEQKRRRGGKGGVKDLFSSLGMLPDGYA